MRGCSGWPGNSMHIGSPSRLKRLSWLQPALASGLSLSPKSETPSATPPDPRGSRPGWRPPRWLLMAMMSGPGCRSPTPLRTLTIAQRHRVNLLPWSPLALGGRAGMGLPSNWHAPGQRAPGWGHCTTYLNGPLSALPPGLPPVGGSKDCSGRLSLFASAPPTRRPQPQSAGQNGECSRRMLLWWWPTQ